MIKADFARQSLRTVIYYMVILLLFLVVPTSCGLFDKEIKQDQHIAEYRRQMNRVPDSLDNIKDRLDAFHTILENIDTDKALITPRKKNILLIEANNFIYKEYVKKENYTKALKYSDIIIGIDSTSPKGYFNRGWIYQIEEKDSLAILDYDKALKLNADYTDAYYNRGVIYQKQDLLDLALEDYNRASKYNPSYITDIYNRRGDIYLTKEIFDKAIENYNKTIVLDTVNIVAYRGRAEAYSMQKDLDKALIDCNKAISLDSANILAYVTRASVYTLQKEYDNAIDDYKIVMHLDPYNELNINKVAKKAIKDLRPFLKKK